MLKHIASLTLVAAASFVYTQPAFANFHAAACNAQPSDITKIDYDATGARNVSMTSARINCSEVAPAGFVYTSITAVLFDVSPSADVYCEVKAMLNGSVLSSNTLKSSGFQSGAQLPSTKIINLGYELPIYIRCDIPPYVSGNGYSSLTSFWVSGSDTL